MCSTSREGRLNHKKKGHVKMRMWMVNPKYMCRKHLLGEHLECHMFFSHMKAGKKVEGYIDSNCLEPLSLKKRHNELAVEMEKRKYEHNTPMPVNVDTSYLGILEEAVVDREKAREDLVGRCSECKGEML